MNLTSKGARRTLAVACSTAVVAAGAAFVAAPASAAGVTLSIFPTGTTVNTLNWGALADATGGGSWNLDADLGPATYAVRVTSDTTTDLYAHLVSAPTTAAKLRMTSMANTTGTVPLLATNWEELTKTTPGTTDKSAVITEGNRNYFTADVPGAYVVKFFEDADASGSLTDDDNVTPAITFNVLDIQANTVATTDDWAPSTSATGSVAIGLPITSTIDLSGLTLIDARGSTSGAGAIGTALQSRIGVAYTGANTAAVGATTYGTTSAARTLAGGSVTAAGTTTSTFTLDKTGDNLGVGTDLTLGTANTNVVDNLVNAITGDATDVVGWVKETGGAVALKTGADKAEYTATVGVSSGDKSGKIVFFTLTPGTNTPTLTADGTLISDTSGTKVYSATTNADGVAKLKVTSSVTTATTSYTVRSATNGNTSALFTATYADAAASTFELTTPSVGLFPTAGTAATLSGKLLDQFGAVFQPAASATQSVTLTVDVNDADGTWDAATTTAYPTISAGAFSYSYTPATTATVGQRDVVRFAYTGATELDSQLKWTSAEAPGSVTITAPVAGATPTQKKATATHNAGTTVTGSVLSTASAGMAYKPVTLTGTAGIYFSDTATPTTATTDDLAKSLTVAADSAGVYTAYAFFTKAGAGTITVTSGSATKTVDVVVTQASDPYQAVAIDAAVEPGGTSVVTGRVNNGWGHPVSGATVDLSLGATTIATLGSNSVTTNADGIWSTTVTGASGADGTATLTATLHGQSSHATPDADWLANAGLTIPNGYYFDQATITVDPDINKTTVSAPSSRIGGGAVKLTGKAKPGSTVEIFAKPLHSGLSYALVGVATADSDGDWSSTEYISRSMVFYAKTTVSSSAPVTVLVKSANASVKMTAKALGKGRVKVTVNGAPNVKGTITLYQNNKKVKSWTSNAWGDGALTVKTSRGVKTFKVVFAPSGYKAAAASAKVNVK